MGKSGLEWLGRLAWGLAVVGAAAILLIATPGAATAQALSQICIAINGGALDAPFVPAGNSTATSTTGAATAGETVTFTWTGNGTITIRVNGVIVHSSTSASGSHVLTLPAGASVTVQRTFIAANPGPGGTLIVTCAAGGTTPPTPPTPGAASDTTAIVDGALSDQASGEPERVGGFFDDLLPSEPPEESRRRIVDFFQRELDEARRDPAAEQWRIDYLEDQLESATARLPVFEYFPNHSPINHSVEAISQYFDFGGNTMSGSFPLQSTVPGWTFNVLIDGAIIDRTFAALNRQTWVGSATISGGHWLDSETVLGLGVKLGGAKSTTNAPVSTVNSTNIGADLAFGRVLAPDLFGGLYFGYELGVHQATISGVGSNFLSHTLKAGGTLRGEMNYGEFTVTPSVSALLQYRHRPSFTDAAAVVTPASDTIDFDVTAGATISRDFDLPEKDLVVTPFLGANILLDYTATTPALVGPVFPGDPFKAQLVGGLTVTWDHGASATLRADISRGANTTMFGITGSLSVPIQ